MFTSDRGRQSAVAALLYALVTYGGPLLADSPNLGRTMTAEELAQIDFTILSNGDGLPAGQGDARQGSALFAQHCMACHGAKGVNGINDPLVGGHGSLDTPRPIRTVGSYWPYATTVFDFIRRAMPYNAPGSLSHDEVYALTAYVLFLNGIIEETVSMNAQSLPLVVMPNRDNFQCAEGIAADGIC